MRLGYSTWGMPSLPIDTAVHHLAQLGYDGIELTVIPGYTTELSTLDPRERQRIKRLLQQHRLTLAALSAHANLLEKDPDAHTHNMARLQGAVDLAVDLAQDDHVPVVVTTPGGAPDQWDERRQQLVERVGELVDYARPRGVTVAMEAHVGAILETPDRVLELLALVGSPYLKVNFDISHFDIFGLPIEETVAALAPQAAHTHVKDQRGRHPDFQFLIPGEGDFDFVTYLRAMERHGYTGFIVAEVSVMVQRRPDYDPLAAATLSYRTLSRAFLEAGIARETKT